MWTANINGNIKLFLDGSADPISEGPAEKIYLEHCDSHYQVMKRTKISTWFFRQYDASYFPIPFSKGCRIEWTGRIKEIAFFIIFRSESIRSSKGTTFTKNDILLYTSEIEKVAEVFKNPAWSKAFQKPRY
jgi:hypothetical protein